MKHEHEMMSIFYIYVECVILLYFAKWFCTKLSFYEKFHFAQVSVIIKNYENEFVYTVYAVCTTYSIRYEFFSLQ